MLQTLGFLLLLLTPPPSAAESPACLAAYRSGGVAAVLASPHCPFLPLRPPSPPPSCDLSTHQGRRRRRRQEDRAVCALDLRIPFLGRGGVREVGVSVIAVFDGHNGDEASEMASRLLLEYFMVHVYFLLNGVYSTVIGGGGRLMIDDGVGEVVDVDELWRRRGSDPERFKFTFAAILDDTFHMEILKKSLLRTVHDIDATFSEEASRKDLESGSTATIVLISDGQILTVNVGDSKALLCSEMIHMVDERKANNAIT